MSDTDDVTITGEFPTNLSSKLIYDVEGVPYDVLFPRNSSIIPGQPGMAKYEAEVTDMFKIFVKVLISHLSCFFLLSRLFRGRGRTT